MRLIEEPAIGEAEHHIRTAVIARDLATTSTGCPTSTVQRWPRRHVVNVKGVMSQQTCSVQKLARYPVGMVGELRQHDQIEVAKSPPYRRKDLLDGPGQNPGIVLGRNSAVAHAVHGMRNICPGQRG